MMEQAEVAAALDARHADARRAFAARDLTAYRALFSPSLAYEQANGMVIGRDQLMRGVATQFARLSWAASAFARRALTLTAQGAIEELTQTADAEATAFGFVHRRWHLERQGAYAWICTAGVWVIQHVRVHAETLAHAGWRFGFSAPLV